jgi:hypothetical protein
MPPACQSILGDMTLITDSRDTVGRHDNVIELS